MTHAPRARFSHIGIHVHDIKVMVEFYTNVLGMEVTDRGRLPLPGEPEIVFLSADPEEHHQIAFVAGRQDGGVRGGVVNQISFRVGGLSELRAMKTAAEKAGVERFMPLNHGRGWSLYFADPEGNGIECFVDSPWHVRQPVVDSLDLSLSDREIMAKTEEHYRKAPDFQQMNEWKDDFARRLAARWGEP